MRESHMLHVIKREMVHFENINSLRAKQLEIRLNALEKVMSERLVMPSDFSKLVDAEYEKQAKEFNQKLKSKIEVIQKS